MRQDQFDRLAQISEDLIDLGLREADPANWDGAQLKPNEMTKETRGNLYWMKKNAVATFALVQRIHSFTSAARAASAAGKPPEEGAVTDPEVDLDKGIEAFEKEAKKLLNEAQKGSSRADFVKKAVGGGK
jgi:hypothetical protein